MGLGLTDTPWYCLYVKPHHEKAVAAAMRGIGYLEYLPLYEARRRWGNHNRSVYLPLFPTYVFGQFEYPNRLPILRIPGVFTIVSTRGKPIPVNPEEIEAVRLALASGCDVGPWPFLAAGDLVEIERGPLRGLEGFLVASKGRHRLILSVTLLQRSVAVEVDREWVRPLETRRQISRREGEWPPVTGAFHVA